MNKSLRKVAATFIFRIDVILEGENLCAKECAKLGPSHTNQNSSSKSCSYGEQ